MSLRPSPVSFMSVEDLNQAIDDLIWVVQSQEAKLISIDSDPLDRSVSAAAIAGISLDWD